MALAVSGWFPVHRLPVRKQDALCCPDFPRGTFANTSRQGRLFVAKIDFILKQYKNDHVALGAPQNSFRELHGIWVGLFAIVLSPKWLAGCRFYP